MRKMCRCLAAVLAVMMCLGLAGCGKDFDAAGYTEAVLDANYQEEYADYAKFRDLSKEKAAKEVESNRIKLVKEELSGIGGVSEDAESIYLESIKSIEKLAKYKVKKAEKKEDESFVVTVEIQPSNVYQVLEKNSEALTKEMTKKGKNPMENVDKFVEFMAECVERSVKDNTYGKEEEIQIKVTLDESGAYGIEGAEMNAVDSALFPQK